MWELIAKLQAKMSDLEARIQQLQDLVLRTRKELNENGKCFVELHKLFSNLRLDDTQFSDQEE